MPGSAGPDDASVPCVAPSPVLARNAVRVSGRRNGPAVVLGHGFGCDQRMWRHVAPAFEEDHRVVLFDHVGSGASDLTAYDGDRYATLDAYAADVVEILETLELRDVAFVGHSVSAMIGVLAANAAPGRIGRLALLGASPRYIDDAEYRGGFSRADVDDLLETLERNFAEWSRSMASIAVATPGRPDIEHELERSFLQTDAAVARQFGRATFLCDHRADLARVQVPTLVLHSTDDPIVPDEVAEYLHRHIAGSTLRRLHATGHYPHLSGPAETVRHLRDFL